MDTDKIILEKEKIIEQIKHYVPLFARFLDVKDPVNIYSDKLYNFKVSNIHKTRQGLIKKILLNKITALFGPDAINQLRVELEENLSFNIADHHQILNHPILVSSNVISSVSKIQGSRRQSATIVISSGDVPPNNYFSKSGFQFHGKTVPLFSANEREYCSYFIPKRDFNFVDRLKNIKRWNVFNESEKNFLDKYQSLVNNINFESCTNYNDQVSLIVKNTWPLIFEGSVRKRLPELIYITQEELIAECLKQILREDNFVSASLFEENLRNKVINNFRGIVVAWNEKEKKGTHFFWRKYPNEPRSLRMYIQGNKLVPEDERFKHLSIELKPDIVIELLEKKEIYPSLFTIFSVLNFYAGVKPLTGYGSTVYLEHFRQAWLKSLENTEYSTEHDLINEVDTTGFIAGIAIFFGRINEQIRALYAADIIAQNGMTKEYLDQVFKMEFNKLLSVATADLYDYFSQKYIPASEKLSKTITFDDLAAINFDWI
ncbi:MAG: hypothetical protein JNN11_00265 [Candidatus Doudnabacteria bacterium]|nr:hypothetical protein [Candidatus Doudnabacteria bacterium]